MAGMDYFHESDTLAYAIKVNRFSRREIVVCEVDWKIGVAV